MRYIFFSLRDFNIDVGESVRIYGLLNGIASQGHDVVFISNATKYHSFDPSIKHVFIDYEFNDKRKLQGLLAMFPAAVVYSKYSKLFQKIRIALQSASVGKEPVYFFDYLDNSIGYMLKQKGLINGYINDLHGITTIEFQNHVKNSNDLKSKALYSLKYYMASRLDKKVFRAADGLIYGSGNMKKYFENLYGLTGKKSYIIPYVLAGGAADRTVNAKLKEMLQDKLQIKPTAFVILFVGSYKATAGVDDLIRAFDLLYKDYTDCKLILVGDGPYKNTCLKLVQDLSAASSIHFIERIPYSQLSTYQSLANVIVCPDKDNLFSQYVVHVKYFDSLISGKIVINGAFKSVQEINQNDFLSISFEPSDYNDLYQKLKFCKENLEALTEKYKGTREYTAKNLTYSSYLKTLTGQEAN